MLPEVEKRKYVVGMDNFFTYPKVVKELSSRGLGFVGTTRVVTPEIKSITDFRFNTLYCQTHSYGHKVFRWIDNNFV